MSSVTRPAPPDQAQRERALNPDRSVLVQAPAGSGKTDLLTRRFLRLLSEVDDPTQIVAITFTKAAAAEMRHRILTELEKAAETSAATQAPDEFSMAALAARALRRSDALGWNLLELPAQLRISTIDSFCRELALQQPLLSGLGGGLDIAEQPEELYRRAARHTLQRLSVHDPALTPAIESLLLWRDNGWQEMENQLVTMLAQRDRWMQDFVLDREPDWDELRAKLERPFARAVSKALSEITALLGHVYGACEEAMALARFACAQSGNALHRELAELAEFPCGPFDDADSLEAARHAYLCLGQLLLTTDGSFRKSVDKRHGFPADRRPEKQRLLSLIQDMRNVPGLEAALGKLSDLPPARYPEDDWHIVRACFTLLRHAAGELRVAFAEAGVVDYVEVAQVAQRVLQDQDGMPTDAALAIADGIHHLLVDEFQDTSRRQHKLISSLAAAWSDTVGRTVFVVGDPMQSIYFFRDADAELFPRVQAAGLELPNGESLRFDFVPLASNFRTAPPLVKELNGVFELVFEQSDGSGISFSPALAARTGEEAEERCFDLHLDFVPQIPRGAASDAAAALQRDEAAELRRCALEAQIEQIAALIRSHIEQVEAARARGEKYRIAVLGRTRNALAPIAAALRDAAIPFRAVELEQLAARPEVLDALALARALFNPEDRVAWLGVLRAPWCALSLEDLHKLTSADDADVLRRPVRELLQSRLSLLSETGQGAANRVIRALTAAAKRRAQQPASTLGTWLEQVWLSLGGADCVDATARANLDLLWSCLDNLPGGEPDLQGRGLTAALQKLTAQPDPAASSDYGVQLMTIHKSKGLEFEIVIVPELQANCSHTRGRLLSWLERGLAEPDTSGALTEFLIAPLQPKGADRGKAKEWVDRVYRAREAQEMRRILYVAATRARERLHLFARPAYKAERDGELSLCEPPESLLSTAWPALEHEVRERFESWKANRIEADADSIAAAGESNLIDMPSAAKPAFLRRLPADYEPPAPADSPRTEELNGISSERLYRRHEGGLLSRALGSGVHGFFEELARLVQSSGIDEARKKLDSITPRIAAQARALGIAQSEASAIASQALEMTLRASRDPIAEWILSPHPEAASEVRWTGVVSGALRTVQADRVFRAGIEPLAQEQESWWIVDYKTAQDANFALERFRFKCLHSEAREGGSFLRKEPLGQGSVVNSRSETAVALEQLRSFYAPQLELYAKVLRLLHGEEIPVRAGLYYPRMLQFDWWEL